MRFAEDVTFITGAGSGIGRATALRLASEGASVFCFDINAQAATETARQIESTGGRAASGQGDVRRRSDIRAAVEAARQAFGRITLLVNNAGVVTMHGLPELTEEDWDYVVDINLKGQFLVAQEIAPVIAAAEIGR